DDGGGVMVASVRGGGDGDGEVAVAAAVGEETGCGDGFWPVDARGLGDQNATEENRRNHYAYERFLRISIAGITTPKGL
ncbi:hypothetical protein Tco_0753241, partial [Tanacetum coccineum]